jgi:hypothetical protein
MLQAGEFAVLPHAPAFRIASDPAISPVDIHRLRHMSINLA